MSSPIARHSGRDETSEFTDAENDGRALPSPLPEDKTDVPAHLERLADRARDYVEAASSANTRRAYASDWKHFTGWCRRQGLEALSPSPQTVGL